MSGQTFPPFPRPDILIEGCLDLKVCVVGGGGGKSAVMENHKTSGRLYKDLCGCATFPFVDR